MLFATYHVRAFLSFCRSILAIHWKGPHGITLSSSRKLHLNNVMKADEGHYVCTIDAFGDPSHAYQVVILGL